MHIQGERRFDASADEVFRVLTDPNEVTAAFSAIELVDAEGPDWTLRLRPGVPGGFRLKFSVRLDDRRPPEHARLRAWGKGLGGRVSVVSSFDLTPDGDATQMRWQAEIDAAGLFGGLGSQAFGPVATRQAERALARLARRLERAPAT